MKRDKDKTVDDVHLTDPQVRLLVEIGDDKIERIASPDGWDYRRGAGTMDRTEVDVLNRLLDVHPRLVATPARSLNGPTSGLLQLTEAGQDLLQRQHIY